MKQSDSKVNIKNKKASFEYEFLDVLTAGIQLTGTEIKSIRNHKASIGEAYCFIKDNELFIKNMNVSAYENGGFVNHEPLRDRKLLIKRTELDKVIKTLKDKGITIVPLRLFISENGFAKLEIAVAKGKKLYDKRESIKEKDVKRNLDRIA